MPIGSFERPFGDGDAWRAEVFGCPRAVVRHERPRMAVLDTLPVASPPSKVASRARQRERRKLKRAARRESTAGPPDEGATRHIAQYPTDGGEAPPRQPRDTQAGTPVAAEGDVVATRQCGAIAGDVGATDSAVLEEGTPTEHTPTWLREAGAALPDGASSGRHSPVPWDASSRLLEEKAALERVLRETHAHNQELAVDCAQAKEERDAQAALVCELRTERAALSLKLERASAEIASLEKAELEAQVKLCQRAHGEAELQTLLEHERRDQQRRLDAARELANTEAQAAAAAGVEETVRSLRAENGTLKTELTRARATLASGLLGSLALMQHPAAEAASLLSQPSPARLAATPAVAATPSAVGDGGDGEPRPSPGALAPPPSPTAGVKGGQPRGLTARLANGATPRAKAAAKAGVAAAAAAAHRALDSKLARLEAELDGKENRHSAMRA